MEKKITKINPKSKLLKGKKRVAAYCRVSSGKDAMLHSLSAQVSYYSGLIQSRPEWEFVGCYADEALTGTKQDRPELQHLMTDCRVGKVDMVITKAISRFARNTVTTLKYVRELRALGIAVYFEEEKIDTLSEGGELMLTVLSAFAQEQSLNDSENQKWRIRKQFKDGEMGLCQQRLYGFKRAIDGGYAIVETEAEVIRLIFDRYLEGAGLLTICRELNGRRVLAPKGGKCNAGGLRYILSNERVIGDLCLQKSYTENHVSKRKIRNDGALPQYYIEDNHPAILSREVFQAVQDELARRAERYGADNRPQDAYPFTGLITCGICGKHYKRKKGDGRWYWQCGTYLRDGKAACAAKQIPESVLEQLSAEFDTQVCISEIYVPSGNRLVFVLPDGTIREREWQYPSRRDSWTVEMRLQAAAHGRKGNLNR
jgi:DNA invertase Pin-like site-specific DNA recombinase